LDGTSVPNFSWVQGVLRHKNRVWVGDDAELQDRLVSAFHCSALGGHSGIPVTYRRIKQVFAWKGLKTSIKKYVQACMVCQQAKSDKTKAPWLLQPLKIPGGAWQTVIIDFIEGLP
jgi:hypothetical protein